MPDPKPSSDFIRDLCGRTKTLRKARGFTQARMAIAMGVSHAAYKKYENGTPLPVHLLVRFAAIAQSDLDFLLTGIPRSMQEEGDESSLQKGKN